MAVLDPAAIALLVKMCAPPGISARLIDAIARVETGGDPTLPPNSNKDGTDDHGLMRINTINLGWTGLTPQSAKNSCNSVSAASKILIRDAGGIEPLKDAVVERLAEAIRRYNGAQGDVYLRKVGGKLIGIPAQPPIPTPSPPSSIEDAPEASEIDFH